MPKSINCSKYHLFETQKQIVAQIKEEQKLIAANKKLIEIYGQKIKDKIADVWGS